MGSESTIAIFSIKEISKHSGIEKASELGLQPRCRYYSGGGGFSLLEDVNIDANSLCPTEYLVWGEIRSPYDHA